VLLWKALVFKRVGDQMFFLRKTAINCVLKRCDLCGTSSGPVSTAFAKDVRTTKRPK
jgi:hypothetical protein